MPRILIVATGPHTFPGAGQIMCRYLTEMAEDGFDVVFIGREMPFALENSRSNRVHVVIAPRIASAIVTRGGIVQTEGELFELSLINQLVECIEARHSAYDKVVLWATYLYPFGHAAVAAKIILSELNLEVSLWITPAGSDIWELGPQLNQVTKSIIDSPYVNGVLTYTRQFASEISLKYGTKRQFETLYPILDFARFRPASADEREYLRRQAHVPPSSFVICSHSNMRPVKRPADVLHVAQQVAKRLHVGIVLLMVGPTPADLTKIAGPPNLTVIWTGIVKNTEDFLRMADVELNCSWHDSFNLSLAEAMACGLPCVTTDCVGIAPEIVQARCGFTFPVEDIGSSSELAGDKYTKVVEYIVDLVNTESLRKTLSLNAVRHARSTFSSATLLPMLKHLMLGI